MRDRRSAPVINRDVILTNDRSLHAFANSDCQSTGQRFDGDSRVLVRISVHLDSALLKLATGIGG